MRSLRIVLLAALVLATAPGARADEITADDLEPCKLYESPVQEGWYLSSPSPALDIRGLWLSVNAGELIAAIDLVDLHGGYPAPTPPTAWHARYRVSWMFGGNEFSLDAYYGDAGWTYTGEIVDGLLDRRPLSVDGWTQGDSVVLTMPVAELESDTWSRELVEVGVRSEDILLRSNDHAPSFDPEDGFGENWYSLDHGCPPK